MDPRYHRLVASATADILKVHRSLQCCHEIVCIIPDGVGVKASWSLGRYELIWRLSKTTGQTLWEKEVVLHCAEANNMLLANDEPAFNTTNTDDDLEMIREVICRILQGMAKVCHCLEIWQHSQNLHAIQKESRAHNVQLTAVGYISNTEDIVKLSRTNFQHRDAAAFIMSEQSPLPAASAANYRIYRSPPEMSLV